MRAAWPSPPSTPSTTFFGPTNLVTLSQPIHFARRGFITGEAGLKNWGYDEVRERLGPIDMLSLHGEDNGLADPWSLAAMKDLADKNSLRWKSLLLPAHGHQDTLIGKDSAGAYDHIAAFLSATPEPPAAAPPFSMFPGLAGSLTEELPALTAKPPSLGAGLAWRKGPGRAIARARADGRCIGAIVVPVRLDAGPQRWRLVDGLAHARWFGVGALGEVRSDSLCCEWDLVATAGGEGDMVLFLFGAQPRAVFGNVLYSSFRAAVGPLAQLGNGHPLLPLQAFGADAPVDLLTAASEVHVAVPLGVGPAVEELLAARPADSLACAVIRYAPAAPAALAEPALCVVLCACQYPAGLLDGTPAHDGVPGEPCGPADRSLQRLLALDARPDRLLAFGDQIYIDATAGLFDPRVRSAPLEAAYAKRSANPFQAAPARPFRPSR